VVLWFGGLAKGVGGKNYELRITNYELAAGG
jgi:hypothetical protein